MMKRTCSSTASQPRTASFLIPIKIGEVCELHVGWRYYDGSLGFYSNAPSNCSVKPPWGRVVSCEFNVTTNKKGQKGDYFRFQNTTGQKCNFKTNIFNIMLAGVSDFTQKVAALRSEGNDQLLAKYFSLLPKAKGFSHHQPEIHTNLGQLKDDDGSFLNEQELSDLKSFVESAELAAIVVEKREEALEHIPTKKKKRENSSNGEALSKKSKIEQMIDDRKGELDDKEGVEKPFVDSFIGRADVPIENILLSEVIAIPLNQFKVMGIANLMEEEFDPALASLTVYPANEKEFDATKLESNRYKIIHGNHRFRAMQMLDKKGVLSSKPGMEDRKITCYIINVRNEESVVFGNIRGNNLASKFQRTPFIHELVFIYETLKNLNKKNPGKALELIIRFAKLLVIHPDDITSIKKVCSWPSDSFQSLVAVLKKFEVFETLDCIDSIARNQGKLMRGEKLKVTKGMLKKIAKCESDYFMDNAAKVLNKEISLKSVLDNAAKDFGLKKVCSQISTMTNYQTMEQLEQKFPGRFSDVVIEKFVGSERGQTSNLKRELLEQYCKSVVTNEDYEPVRYENVEKLSDISKGTLEKFDVLVLNLVKFDVGVAIDVMEIARKTSKPLLSVLFLFKEEEDQLEAIKYIGTLTKPADITSRLVFFKADKPKILKGFLMNTVYGILLGKVTIFDVPLHISNGDLKSDLDVFIAKICPVKARVAFLNEGNLTISSVHGKVSGSRVSVVYYGCKTAIDKFLKTSEGSSPAALPASYSNPLTLVETPSSVLEPSRKRLFPVDLNINVTEPGPSGDPYHFGMEMVDFNTEGNNINTERNGVSAERKDFNNEMSLIEKGIDSEDDSDSNEDSSDLKDDNE